MPPDLGNETNETNETYCICFPSGNETSTTTTTMVPACLCAAGDREHLPCTATLDEVVRLELEILATAASCAAAGSCLPSTSSPIPDTATSTTTTEVLACTAPTDASGGWYTVAVATADGRPLVWVLTCPADFAPDPATGNRATCSITEGAVLHQPAPCQTDTGCYSTDALPGGSAVGTGCPVVMSEGETCQATCSEGATPLGHFVCSFGDVLHTSVCVLPGEQVTTQQLEKVAGSISAYLAAVPAEKPLRRALCAALDLGACHYVHGLRWRSLLARQRRLGGRLPPRRSGRAGPFRRLTEGGGAHASAAGFPGATAAAASPPHHYVVAYEIIVPPGISGFDLAALAERLAVAGSSVQQVLLETLRADGVVATGIAQVAAPRIFTALVLMDSRGMPLAMPKSPPPRPSVFFTTQPPEEDGGTFSDAAIAGGVVGSILAFLLVIFVVWVCMVIRRRRAKSGALIRGNTVG